MFDHARLGHCCNAQTTFGRVMVGGLMLILFVYVFVNIGMVSGIYRWLAYLALVSYGGSALVVLMAGFGIVMSIHTHRKCYLRIYRGGQCVRNGFGSASQVCCYQHVLISLRPQQQVQQTYSGPVEEIGGAEPRYEPLILTLIRIIKLMASPTVLSKIQNFSQIGLASSYGEEARGNTTATGEIFDPNALTAAHPTLPIPSYVRVTNVSNGRQIVVRVNDQAPTRRAV